MSITIKFENVSKLYRTGMTRTSLPTLLQKSITNLHSSFNKRSPRNNHFWALKDINFELCKGQSLALIGPNGAGKTTILKLLANITRPTKGKIESYGRISALIELGAGFHPDLSGLENIYLNGTILGLKKSEIRKRFDEIADFAEIDQFLDTPVKRYSSGMAVRLGFAVAACIEPDILLVDEVLAVGDISFRQKCMVHIKNLLKNGTSLIFVSHNLGLVKAVCEYGLFIDGGKVLASGPVQNTIEYYTQALNKQRMKKLAGNHQISRKHDIPLEIIRVLVQSQNGVYDLLSNDNPAEIIAEYISYHNLPDIKVVVRIVRSDGVSCCVMYSDHEKVDLPVSIGEGTISVKLDPLQLFPGAYYVAVTMKNADGTVTYSQGWSDWFQVTGSLLGEADLDAVYEPIRRWRHVHSSIESPHQAAHGLRETG
jgi:lipopolysaccharide transport system ATP-binding protein